MYPDWKPSIKTVNVIRKNIYIYIYLAFFLSIKYMKRRNDNYYI